MQAVGHGNALVVFIEGIAGDCGHRELRNQLSNEHHASAAGTLHIKAQIDFLECLVEWDADSAQARAIELESDVAQVGLAVVSIEFSPRRDQGQEERGINGVVEHD